jgi:hypothetical protein
MDIAARLSRISIIGEILGSTHINHILKYAKNQKILYNIAMGVLQLQEISGQKSICIKQSESIYSE